MRRQDIQLVALARQGDRQARLELGRRYLLGAEGFARHVEMGIEYLQHDSVRGSETAAAIIGENLPLQDILRHGQLDALDVAARAGLAAARIKRAAWWLVAEDRPAQALQALREAALQGHATARAAVQAANASASTAQQAIAALRALSGPIWLDAADVTEWAARQAFEAGLPERAARALRQAHALQAPASETLHALVVQSLAHAASAGADVAALSVELAEEALESRVKAGDAEAGYLLGLALCGIDAGALKAARLTTAANVRRGAALLLRAADAGRDEAWLHLYRLHANHRLSVANPQMARFFLEKSAVRGHAESQRRLGALMLRSSGSLAETEQAIAWLHQASLQGDESAAGLLASLVLPMPGRDEDARAAVERVRREDPWLATRMLLSREFGLTKLEALCVDPVKGLRPWGLVVGKNPFVSQARRAAPRAVPARRAQAQEELRRAALLFAQALRDEAPGEDHFRRRTLQQRRLFTKLGIDEAMFFAQASSTELDVLRQGPKWAHRAKDGLEEALAA